MIAIARLDATIRAAGIPIDGVSGAQGAVRIDFKATATAQQQTQAQTIVAGFDWSAAGDTAYRAAAEVNLADFRDQTTAMQTELEADLLVAQNSATTLNQLRAVVRNALQRERRTLKAVRRLIDTTGLL